MKYRKFLAWEEVHCEMWSVSFLLKIKYSRVAMLKKSQEDLIFWLRESILACGIQQKKSQEEIYSWVAEIQPILQKSNLQANSFHHGSSRFLCFPGAFFCSSLATLSPMSTTEIRELLCRSV